MTNRCKLSLFAVAILMGVFAVTAQAGNARQDAKAIEVLKQMATYKSSLEQVSVKGVTFTDARLDAGLMVSNPVEVHVSIKHPGSMKINSFDGVATKGIYFHDGLLTVFNSADKLYAQASIPKEIDAAMEFALEELGVEAPLMDLLYKDVFTQLISSDETIHYLTDKSRVGGADCHQLAIRGSDVDVQLWVEEGDQPLPRKLIITSKWEGGTPRFIANLSWNTQPRFEPGVFEFMAPEGAAKIEFVTESSEQ